MTTAAEAQAELDRRAALTAGQPTQAGPTVAAAAAELQRRQVAAQPRGIGAAIYDNLIGDPNDGVESYGERAGSVIGDLFKSAGSGAARGVRGVAQLPAMIGGSLDRGYEALGIIPEGAAAGMRERDPLSAQNIARGASALTLGGTDYQPETRAGRFAQTGTEFATGAAIMGGPQLAVRAGLIPGIASEGAGELTEGVTAFGQPVEPYARLAAGIGAGLLATPRSGNYTRGADADELASANRLTAAGVRPTAGQVRNSPALMRMEGTSATTGQQLDDLTAAAMATTGSTARNTRPAALVEASDRITEGMNSILRDVDVPVSTGIGQRVADIAADYGEATAGKIPQVNVRRVADEIMDVATSPSARTIPATTLREWRTRLGRMTTSSDEAVRDMAHELRTVIDDVTESQLASFGRVADIEQLAVLRNQYRNFLIIADASTRGGREAARGLLTPERLSTASTRTVGRTNAALGRGTDLSELATDATGIIGSTSTVAPDAVRNIKIMGGGIAGGAGLGTYLGGPVGGLIGAGVGVASPEALRLFLRSPAVQNALNDPQALARLAPVIPGLLSQEPQR